MKSMADDKPRALNSVLSALELLQSHAGQLALYIQWYSHLYFDSYMSSLHKQQVTMRYIYKEIIIIREKGA